MAPENTGPKAPSRIDIRRLLADLPMGTPGKLELQIKYERREEAHEAELKAAIQRVLELSAERDNYRSNPQARRETFQNEIVRTYKRVEGPFTFALIEYDIKNFKDFNDVFGHLAGDEVLKALRDILRSQIRLGSDKLGAIGGDEFWNMIRPSPSRRQDNPENHLKDVLGIVNRCNELFERRDWFKGHPEWREKLKGGVFHPPTLDAGITVATIRPEDRPLNFDLSLLEVWQMTDELMYKTKNSYGRDDLSRRRIFCNTVTFKDRKLKILTQNAHVPSSHLSS